MDSIFNHQPTISEDTLQYTIYPSVTDNCSPTACAALGTKIISLVHNLLPRGFLWHRDSFELKVIPYLQHEAANLSSGKSSAWKLEGRMRVGDSVDDEWCVVWLLREITKSLDVAVSVFDSDGEFLLIEAAEALPAWVSPENAENRVWLYKSSLHLVPIFYASPPSVPRRRRQRLISANDSDDENNGNDEEYLGPADALRLLREENTDSTAPEEVQSRVWARIAGYPASALQHTHRAKAYIPVDIALALRQRPELIQRAVETFYTRDAVQLRAVHHMKRFPPSSSVLATVSMTRPAYAQLLGQKFHPPKVYGRWTEREGTPEWKLRDLGMKIACGFEMLYAETKSRAQSQTAPMAPRNIEALKDALQRDVDYQKYIRSLQQAGFFSHELTGSAKWKELETRAAETWIEMRRVDDVTRQSFAETVNDAVSESTASLGLKNPSAETPSFESGEDTDTWLSIDPNALDVILQDLKAPVQVSSAVKGESAEDIVVAEQAGQLRNLAGKVQAFVEGEGGLEGAKFEDDLLSDEEISDGEDMLSDEPDSEPESDVEPMSPAERAAAQAALVPPLPAAEYGVMPVTYSNSQPVSAPTIATETVPTSAAISLIPEHAPLTEGSGTGAPRPIRRPILMRDRYDGVDSDDESEQEDEIASLHVTGNGDDDDGSESDEDRPIVVGEIEVDMEAEEEEFLQFSREALGITQFQWDQIIKERSARGAFIPASAEFRETPKDGSMQKTPLSPIKEMNKPSRVADPKHVPFGDAAGRNPNLNSFEAVMAAMDEVLQSRNDSSNLSKSTPKPSSEGKGKARAVPAMNSITELNDDSSGIEDVESSMAAELKASLETNSGSEDDDEIEGETPIDYNLIKNFLQSFKAQEGLSGPVSSLAGRLSGGSWAIPNDK